MAVRAAKRHGSTTTPPRSASAARALVTAARPLQWTKNLVVFAGIVFAAKIDDPSRWRDALLIFAAYCAASSAAYLVNDVRDAADDRIHSVKRLRPVAAGTLPAATAVRTALALLALALVLAVAVGVPSLLLLSGFVGLQLAYSVYLKHVVLVDVLCIAALFVIRAAAGAVAVDVRLSPWLILCSGLLALFLGLTKRRAELGAVAENNALSRRVLTAYTTTLVDQLVTIVGAATIVAYAIYTVTATGSDAMMLTIPFVVFGLFRYLYLVDRESRGEDPDRILVTDRPMFVAVALWVGASAVILAVEGAPPAE